MPRGRGGWCAEGWVVTCVGLCAHTCNAAAGSLTHNDHRFPLLTHACRLCAVCVLPSTSSLWPPSNHQVQQPAHPPPRLVVGRLCKRSRSGSRRASSIPQRAQDRRRSSSSSCPCHPCATAAAAVSDDADTAAAAGGAWRLQAPCDTSQASRARRLELWVLLQCQH